MAMTILELGTVQKLAQAAKTTLKLKAQLDALNVDYDASGGVKETLGAGQTGDDNLASEPSLSNLTKAQLDDAAYALTNGLKTQIDNTYAQLEKLASRAENTNLTLG